MFSVLGLITMTIKDNLVCLLCITYLHRAGLVNGSGAVKNEKVLTDQKLQGLARSSAWMMVYYWTFLDSLIPRSPAIRLFPSLAVWSRSAFLYCRWWKAAMVRGLGMRLAFTMLHAWYQSSWNIWMHSFKVYSKWSVHSRTHTHACAECSHSSVGLAQAHPNKSRNIATWHLWVKICMLQNNSWNDTCIVNKCCCLDQFSSHTL